MIYHFQVESKPHEEIDLLITASVNIYQTKKAIPIVMKTFFSYGKLKKQFRKPSFFLKDHPCQLSNNSPISEQFFHDAPPPTPPLPPP